MRWCLYDPLTGYYRRRDRDPFGCDGDYYTAVQIDPVFGEALSAYLEGIDAAEVVDLGAGRGGLRQALSRWKYHAVDWDLDALPTQISGAVIANEFFDALPVRLLRRCEDGWRELLVDEGKRYAIAEELHPELADYALRYGSEISLGGLLEVNLEMGPWLQRISGMLTAGRLLVIDYGYEGRELLRFPQGTLMSYRRHSALADVLSDPGGRDLTAHVNFTELKRLARRAGMTLRSECLLAAWVLDVFGLAQMQRRWETADERWRLLFKQLVFGLGETFRVLEFEKIPK